MKKHLLSLFLFITLSPFGYSQDEASYIELAKVIQTNGAKSQAKMFIAPKAKDNAKLRNEFFDYESIKIDAVIEPASDDAGRKIDIFVVIRKQVGSKKTFYALDEDGVWTLWNGSLKSLPIYESIESASDKHEFTVYDGTIEADEFNIYFGYSSENVDDKPIIHVNLNPYKIKAVDENSTKYISSLSMLNRRTNYWIDLAAIRDPVITARNQKEFQENVGRGPMSWVFLDVDLDGDDDIFQAHFWYGSPYEIENIKRIPAELYINDGDNNFTYSEEFFLNEIPTFIHPIKSISGDFNSDGYPDIFVSDQGYDASPFPGATSWFILSDGSGKYISKEFDELIGFFHGAAAGDLDGDSDIDVFDVEGYFHINDGKGNFEVVKSDLNMYARYTVEIFDLNNDGYNEIIVSGHEWDTPTTIYLGNENYTYSEDFKVIIDPNDTWGVVRDLLVDDLNQDGNYEIILARTRGPENFYDGNAIQIITLDTDLNVKSSIMADKDINKRWVDWLRVADVDNDGDKDIVSDDKGMSYGRPLVLLNDGNEIFQEGAICTAPTNKVYYTEHIDINNDGLVDTVTSGHTWITPTTITFGSLKNIILKDKCKEELKVVEGFETTTRMALGDMDGDGATDIVLAQTQRDSESEFSPKFEGYALVIYYLTEEGRYKNFEKVAENLDTKGYMKFMRLEDLNEDGQLDIRAEVGIRGEDGDEGMSFTNGVDFNL